MMAYALQTAASISLETPTPFTLQLEHDSEHKELLCIKILRLVPNKRLVCLVEENGHQRVFKFFFNRSHFQRELQGLRLLAEHGIAAPEPLFSVKDDSNKCYLIALDYIPHKADLRSAWDSAQQDAERLALMSEGLALLARMHQSGLYQNDIHWRNFLLSDDNKLIVIDAGDVNAAPVPLTGKIALNNIGLFLAQINPADDELASRCMNHYTDLLPLDNDALAAALAERRHYRLKRYAKKSLRDSTEFCATDSWRYAIVQRRDFKTSALQTLMDKLDERVDKGVALKRGNTATVSQIDFDNRPIVLKRYNVKSLLHFLSRCWRPSRAINSWQSAHYLKIVGVPTPPPLAAIEKRWGPLRRQAYLISEHFDGISLRDYVKELGDSGSKIPEWLDNQLSAMLKNLWRSGLSHGDFKATNFLVGHETLILIDLDSMQLHTQQASLQQAINKDVKRFLANWQGEQLAHFRALIAPVMHEFKLSLD